MPAGSEGTAKQVTSDGSSQEAREDIARLRQATMVAAQDLGIVVGPC